MKGNKLKNLFKHKSNKNRELCDACNSIKRILEQGYEIKKWINIHNEDALFLVRKGESPWKGVYLQKIENKMNIDN